MRSGISRDRFRGRAPPAPRRSTLTGIAGQRLMASAAELNHDQNYRVPHGFFTAGLAEQDSAVEDGIRAELHREQTQIELIASENIVSKAVLEAEVPGLTNKNDKGYPGRR